MTLRDRPPFRADHVGSLLRPPGLLEARARHAAGEIDLDALREVEDRAVAEVVALQRDAGLRTATDGEMRRTSWHMDFIYSLDGVDSTDERLQVHFRNADGDLDFESAALRVHDRVRLGDTIFGDAFAFLAETVRQSADALTPKLTIPSPSMVHYRGGRAAIDEESTPSSRSSGPTCRRRTPSSCAGSPTSAAPTSSSTTPAWPTSTTRSSVRSSRRRAATPSTSTSSTSAPSTPRSPTGPRGYR